MDVYIGTILFEPRRWGPNREVPAFRVSEWQDRLAVAGFDGMELWANHVLCAGLDEAARIAAGPLDVAIFNSYATLDAAGAVARQQAVEMVNPLGAKAVKYNFGREIDALETELAALRDWRQRMPAGVQMLCECHPGTIAETPGQAKTIFDGLDSDVFGAMLHPFNNSPDSLNAWFDALGDRIRHMHVQRRADGDWQAIGDDAGHAAEIIDICRKRGFDGNWTIEFTRGVHPPDESPDELLANATADLTFLREHFT
jgi:sugar phosphate isomerase/epimerase